MDHRLWDAMIAIIGDRESILPFKAFGIAGFEAGKPSEAEKILVSIEPDKYEIVFMTEELMQGLKKTEIVSAVNVVAIPGRKGGSGYGREILRELIKKATGTETA